MAITSFFKIMNNDFATQLLLPKAFVRDYGELLSETAKLRTYTGKTWNVGLERTDEENCCYFTRGWADFVNDVQLELYEVVTFWFNVGESTFDVAVLGISGIEREIPCNTSSDDDDNEEENTDEIEDEAAADDEEVNPSFKKLLTRHNASRMPLQHHFSMAAGLRDKETAVLKYPRKKRCWCAILKTKQHSVDIVSGWTEFRKENGLVDGETYMFEYIRGENVIQVKPVNGGNEEGADDYDNVKPNFKILLKEHHSSRVSLHLQFIRDAELMGHKAVVLKYPPKQCCWSVLLDRRPPNRFDLRMGWSDFRKENNLVYGETYVFECIRAENVIHVRLENCGTRTIIKNET